MFSLYLVILSLSLFIFSTFCIWMVRLNVLIASEYAAFCLAENPPFAPIGLYHKGNMRNFAADWLELYGAMEKTYKTPYDSGRIEPSKRPIYNNVYFPFLFKSSCSSCIQVLFNVKSLCCLVTISDVLIIFVNKLKS